MTQPIPGAGVPPINPQTGRFTSEWYRFFKLLPAVAESEDAPEYRLAGPHSVVVSGLLQNGFASVSLRNDRTSPGALSFYGTDEGGDKGWNPLMPRVMARLSLRL